MNPVPRERLPYPDLPVQRDDRPLQRDMPRDDRPMGRPAQSREPVARTVIDRDSQFDGNFRSDSDLLIEGTFEGEIDCKGTVIVAEGANVSATVRARNVVVAGSANGEVSCDERMTIQATGEVRGKAQAATLVVEEGAFFEGEFKMGAGGFSAIGSNFSNWQGGRPQKNNGSSRPGEGMDESEEGAARGEGPAAEGRAEPEPPKRDAWS